MDYKAIADNIVMQCAMNSEQPVLELSARIEDTIRQIGHTEYLRGVKDTLTMKKEQVHENLDIV